MEEHLTVICPVTGYPTHFSCLVGPVTGQIDPALLNIAPILLNDQYYDAESSEKINCYRQNAQNYLFFYKTDGGHFVFCHFLYNISFLLI